MPKQGGWGRQAHEQPLVCLASAQEVEGIPRSLQEGWVQRLLGPPPVLPSMDPLVPDVTPGRTSFIDPPQRESLRSLPSEAKESGREEGHLLYASH